MKATGGTVPSLPLARDELTVGTGPWNRGSLWLAVQNPGYPNRKNLDLYASLTCSNQNPGERSNFGPVPITEFEESIQFERVCPDGQELVSSEISGMMSGVEWEDRPEEERRSAFPIYFDTTVETLHAIYDYGIRVDVQRSIQPEELSPAEISGTIYCRPRSY
ncbi:hypothetical protein [Streptomyces sp. NPDC051909]|uniref:hypothetical protein n=1 Tax=Streptomyces sp. NPDC051909 TaxID=3154944 RepID=UPI00341EDB63